MLMENERQAIEFIEAVFRREHLQDEFRRWSEAADTLCQGLSLEATSVFLGNLRSFLEETAARLDVAEQTVSALLPAARQTLEAWVSKQQRAASEALKLAVAADDFEEPAGPDLSEMKEDEFDDRWFEVPEPDVVADTLAPDSPFEAAALSWEPLSPTSTTENDTAELEAEAVAALQSIAQEAITDDGPTAALPDESPVDDRPTLDTSELDDEVTQSFHSSEPEANGIREEDVISLLRQEGAVTSVVHRVTMGGMGRAAAPDFWGTSPLEPPVRASESDDDEGEKGYV